MKMIMMVIGCGFIFLIILSLWGFYSATHPYKIISTLTPKDLGIPYEPVTFVTRDNITLRGWFIPSPNPKAKTIILLHGYPADKGNILPSRIFLHKDFNLLFFDFRYLGESGGDFSTAGKYEVYDLMAAVDYLQSRGIKNVGVWGFSMGASVALIAAVYTPEIKAIVAESPYARTDWMIKEYYRMPFFNIPLAQLTRFWAWLFLHYDLRHYISPAESAHQLKIPILLIHSKNDKVINIRHATLLEQELKNNPQAQIIITDNAAHGALISDYDKVIKNFFANNL